MKQIKESKEIEWLGSYYRISKHFSPDLIKIEEKVEVGVMFKSWQWQTIYFGHIDPIKEAVDYFLTPKT